MSLTRTFSLVVDAEFRQRRIALRLQLFVIADDEIDFLHFAEGSGSVCAAQPVTMMRALRVVATGLADRLLRLAYGLAGHGAGVEDDGAVFQFAERPPLSRRMTSDS
jgi:hypothetical protein